MVMAVLPGPIRQWKIAKRATNSPLLPTIATQVRCTTKNPLARSIKALHPLKN
jgi:hypothetical protein